MRIMSFAPNQLPRLVWTTRQFHDHQQRLEGRESTWRYTIGQRPQHSTMPEFLPARAGMPVFTPLANRIPEPQGHQLISDQLAWRELGQICAQGGTSRHKTDRSPESAVMTSPIPSFRLEWDHLLVVRRCNQTPTASRAVNPRLPGITAFVFPGPVSGVRDHADTAQQKVGRHVVRRG